MKAISLEDFKKLDLRVGRIVGVREHPNAEKLYILEVDFGKEKRRMVAGIKERYRKEELEGKLVVALLNLEPKEIRGVRSEGMILAAVSGKEIALVTPDREISPGSRVC